MNKKYRKIPSIFPRKKWHKKRLTSHRYNLLTLAAFLPWGSSEGAGRVSRRKSNTLTAFDSKILINLFIISNRLLRWNPIFDI